MGTPFYHTDESALEIVKEYQEIQGYETIKEALACMECCIDELDNEERSAYCHTIRLQKTRKEYFNNLIERI